MFSIKYTLNEQGTKDLLWFLIKHHTLGAGLPMDDLQNMIKNLEFLADEGRLRRVEIPPDKSWSGKYESIIIKHTGFDTRVLDI